jgi:hypothetical protein
VLLSIDGKNGYSSPDRQSGLAVVANVILIAPVETLADSFELMAALLGLAAALAVLANGLSFSKFSSALRTSRRHLSSRSARASPLLLTAMHPASRTPPTPPPFFFAKQIALTLPTPKGGGF